MCTFLDIGQESARKKHTGKLPSLALSQNLKGLAWSGAVSWASFRKQAPAYINACLAVIYQSRRLRQRMLSRGLLKTNIKCKLSTAKRRCVPSCLGTYAQPRKLLTGSSCASRCWPMPLTGHVSVMKHACMTIYCPILPCT